MSDDRLLLRHILDAIAKVEHYALSGAAAFINAGHWHDATLYQLAVIGEAAKRLLSEIKAQEGEIPWKRIAGLRDVLIH